MTTIITGANRGLGYETARALATDRSRTLVLAGRDRISLSQARGRIQADTGNLNLVPMHLDLASLASVRVFVTRFRSRDLPPLSILICNAGLSPTTVCERSAEGYELAFAVNHLGHFLLTHLLLDCLQPPARLLFVSSAGHDPARAKGPMRTTAYVKAEWLAYPERNPNLPTSPSAAGGLAYAASKLCNVLFAYELVRRLAASGLSTPERPITSNVFVPGLLAGTDLGRYQKGLMRLVWYHLLPAASRVMGFGRTARQAGADLATLATDPALSGVTGQYFDGRERAQSSAESYDLDKAAELWRYSVQLCGLQGGESPLAGGQSHPHGGHLAGQVQETRPR
jgi:NAD(P)-dependent dehydrogenase (short-subunit alcohol dehydrogenase family)